jgi:hypothetical protein
MSAPSRAETFLTRFVKVNVCSHKGPLLMPLVPAFVLGNVLQPTSFFAAWGIVVFLWVIIWFGLPCNPNLNCTALSSDPSIKQGKDGLKALVVAFLLVYGILTVVAVAARFLICSNGDLPTDRYGGGILTNIGSLFEMEKVVKPGFTNHLKPYSSGSVSNQLSARKPVVSFPRTN